jgi:hypothetical protein
MSALNELSRTAVKTRVHWLDNLTLASGRVGLAKESPMDIYHLLVEVNGQYNENQYSSGYDSLCGNAYSGNLLVKDVSRADVDGLRVCEKCRRKKAKMLEAHRALVHDK